MGIGTILTSSRESVVNKDVMDCLWNVIATFKHRGEKQVKFTYSVLRLKTGGTTIEIRIFAKKRYTSNGRV